MIDVQGKISDDERLSNYFYEYARLLQRGNESDKKELVYLRSKLHGKSLEQAKLLEKVVEGK